VTGRPDDPVRRRQSRLHTRHSLVDEPIDKAFELGIAPFAQHVRGGFDCARAVEAPRLLVFSEQMLDGDRPVDLTPRCPEVVCDLYLRVRDRLELVIAVRMGATPCQDRDAGDRNQKRPCQVHLSVAHAHAKAPIIVEAISALLQRGETEQTEGGRSRPKT
jgi:hypothetical protein